MSINIRRRNIIAASVAAMLPLHVQGNPGLDTPIGRIRWQLNTGGVMTLAELMGKPLVLTMSYTACRRTCSTTMLALREMQTLFEQKKRDVNFAIVTFDPERDSAREWTNYRSTRGLTQPNWHFLTGTPQDTRRIARFLDVDYWRYGQHVMHDFRISLFDVKGQWHKDIVWDRPRDLNAFLADV